MITKSGSTALLSTRNFPNLDSTNCSSWRLCKLSNSESVVLSDQKIRLPFSKIKAGYWLNSNKLWKSCLPANKLASSCALCRWAWAKTVSIRASKVLTESSLPGSGELFFNRMNQPASRQTNTRKKYKNSLGLRRKAKTDFNQGKHKNRAKPRI